MNSLDLEHSYIYFGCDANNSWRSSIKSTLSNVTDNKIFYLSKECRAERVGQYPFVHPAKSELCLIVENKKHIYLIRNSPVLKGSDFNNQNYSKRSYKNFKTEIVLKKQITNF